MWRGTNSRFNRPNDLTDTTIRGVDALSSALRRLIIPFHFKPSGSKVAGHIRFGDIDNRMVCCRVGQSCVVTALVLAGRASSSDPLSSHFRLVVALFSKATGRIRFDDVVLRSATRPTE